MIHATGEQMAYGSALSDLSTIYKVQEILDDEFAIWSKADTDRAAGRITAMLFSVPGSAKRKTDFDAIVLDDGTTQSAGDMNGKIVQWFYTGKGLKDGDYIITEADLGGSKTFMRKRKVASLPLNVAGKEGTKVKVIFIAENDRNFGLVLNCYYYTDYEKGDTARPVFSFKYFRKLGKVVKIDLAALDIIFAFYRIKKKMISMERPYRTRVSTLGFVNVNTKKIGIPALDRKLSHGAPIHVSKALMRKGLSGKDVVVLLEDDGNHGQVINVYLEENYAKKNKTDPLLTYKYCEGIRKTAVPVTLGEMDVVDAYHGKKLSILGRACETTVTRGNLGCGVCRVQFYGRREEGMSAAFNIPRELMAQGALGKRVVVRVENDPNHGQVINIYFKSAFIASAEPKPIITYAFIPERMQRGKKGACRSVNLADLDIESYYRGKTTVQPVGMRSTEIPVLYWQNKFGDGFDAVWGKKLLTGKSIRFGLSPAAKRVFDKNKTGQRVQARIRDDKDYGSYIELFKGNRTVATFYYMKNIGKCVPADIEKLAFLDYVAGEPNVYGKPTIPRPYYHDTPISKDRPRIRPTHRGRPRIVISRLDILAGKMPVFIPVEDETHGYLFHVHDQEEYKRDRQRKPDLVMVRNRHFNSLVPIDALEIYQAREFIDKGIYGMAIQLLDGILRREPKRREALILIKIARDLRDARLNKMRKPSGISQKNRFDFYLAALADSLMTGDAIAGQRALEYFKEKITKNKKEAKDLSVRLSGKLVFDRLLPAATALGVASLRILSEFPDEYKTIGTAVKVSESIEYQGIYRDAVRKTAAEFFESIQEEHLFRSPGQSPIEAESQLHGIGWYLNKIGEYRLLSRVGEIKTGYL
ncbi:MAG: hypothetical protein PHS37_10160, partial [Candidatus Omnitrophica bacterium]|nr:hypothetical protein [Candidatus Omnitrophota bacterium]